MTTTTMLTTRDRNGVPLDFGGPLHNRSELAMTNDLRSYEPIILDGEKALLIEDTTGRERTATLHQNDRARPLNEAQTDAMLMLGGEWVVAPEEKDLLLDAKHGDLDDLARAAGVESPFSYALQQINDYREPDATSAGDLS